MTNPFNLNALWRIIGGPFYQLYKTISGNKISGLLDSVDNMDLGQAATSMFNKQTGADLTGAQKAENAFNAAEAEKARQFNAEQAELAYNRQRDLTRDTYALNVEGMQNAGLNPALAYGGISTPSTPTAASGPSATAGNNNNGMSMSELMSIITMPLQMEQMRANIEKTNAETDNTVQRTLTEEQETIIRRIRAEYGEQLTAAELKNALAAYDKTVADTDLAISNSAKIQTETDAQKIINEYLPQEKASSIAKMDADAKLENAKTTYQNWLNDFVKTNDFLPSSNDALMVVTYLMDLLGLDKNNIKNVFDLGHRKLKHDLKEAKKGKGGPSSSQAGNGEPSGSSSAGGSR